METKFRRERSMGVRGELFSTKVQLANRTYFFNVKENRMGDLYLNIVESKNREIGGFERQSVVLFADDLSEFLSGFEESLRVMEKATREKKRGAGRSQPRDERHSSDERRESAPEARRASGDRRDGDERYGSSERHSSGERRDSAPARESGWRGSGERHSSGERRDSAPAREGGWRSSGERPSSGERRDSVPAREGGWRGGGERRSDERPGSGERYGDRRPVRVLVRKDKPKSPDDDGSRGKAGRRPVRVVRRKD
jgi:hypothetical protein